MVDELPSAAEGEVTAIAGISRPPGVVVAIPLSRQLALLSALLETTERAGILTGVEYVPGGKLTSLLPTDPKEASFEASEGIDSSLAAAAFRE